METKQRKLKIWIRVLFSLLGIFIVIFIVAILVTSKGRFSIDGLSRAITYRNLGSAEQAKQFNFDDRQAGTVELFGEGLLVVSEYGYEYFAKNGELFLSGSESMVRPAMSVCNGNAAVYDIGGSAFTVLNESEVLFDGEMDEREIVSLRVNREGWSAVCTTSTKTKGVVTVYNNEGIGVYEVSVSSGYPVCADVSPDSTGMYVIILTDAGSSIVRYDFSSEKEQAVYNAEGTVYLDIEYTADDIATVISGDKTVFLNRNCEEIATYDYSDSYLGGYEVLDGLLLHLSEHANAESSKIVLLDGQGEVKVERDISGSVRDISYSGKYAGVLYSDELVIYNSELEEYNTSNEIQGASEILVRQDGTVFLISAFQATLYVP